jgi:hypothetical protein
VLPLGGSFQWHEYELKIHALPGHTRYAVAVEVTVDGCRVLARGDQEATDGARDPANYYYRNRFGIDDYVASAALYEAVRPDIVVSGHSYPRRVTREYLAQLAVDGRLLADLHRDLLPLDDVDLGAEGFAARIEPYRSTVVPGGVVELDVEVLNPFGRAASAVVQLAVPHGWPDAEPQEASVVPHGTATLRFALRAGPTPQRRARVGVDVTVDGRPFGQQAEALVDVG